MLEINFSMLQKSSKSNIYVAVDLCVHTVYLMGFHSIHETIFCSVMFNINNSIHNLLPDNMASDAVVLSTVNGQKGYFRLMRLHVKKH